MLLLLADENFPVPSYKKLLAAGIDIKHIILENASIDDREVIEIALKEDRIILTFDSDFGELIFKFKFRPKGVIFFRWKDFLPTEPGDYLLQLLEDKSIQFIGYLTVIDREKIRQRLIS